MQLEPLAFAIFCTIVSLIALWRGGRPEQVVACGFLIAFYATLLTQSPLVRIYHGVEWSMAGIDFLLLLIIGIVALGSTRYWGMPMASMQLLDVFGHLAKMLDPTIVAQAYFGIVGLISWPMVATLGCGVVWHRRRLALFGVDHDWVGDLPLRYRLGWEATPSLGRGGPRQNDQ